MGYGPCLEVDSTSRRHLNLVPLMHQIPSTGNRMPVIALPFPKRRMRLLRRRPTFSSSQVFKHPERRRDAFVWNEQTHAFRSALHRRSHTDDQGRHAGGIQCDLCEIGIDSCRVCPDGLHDDVLRQSGHGLESLLPPETCNSRAAFDSDDTRPVYSGPRIGERADYAVPRVVLVSVPRRAAYVKVCVGRPSEHHHCPCVPHYRANSHGCRVERPKQHPVRSDRNGRAGSIKGVGVAVLISPAQHVDHALGPQSSSCPNVARWRGAFITTFESRNPRTCSRRTVGV